MCKKVMVLTIFIFVLAGSTSADLLVNWRLDEGSGTTVTDASGNGMDGTFAGEPQWVAGHNSAGALQFDGVDDYVVHDLGETVTYAAFSIAFWVKADTLGQPNFAGAFTGHFPNSAGFQIDVDGASPGSYRVNPNSGNQSVFGPVTTDWVHLTLTAEGAAINLYYNGIWAASNDLVATDLVFNQYAIGVNRNRNWWFAGTIDDLHVYDHVLNETEILTVMEGDRYSSSAPHPEDGMSDVVRTMSLEWQSGEFAAKHDVYFGTVFDDVNDAGVESDLLVSQGQEANTYDPGILDLGQTYYWRVDEVNAAPDSTVFKGETWSFTVEPVSYALPIGAVSATASSMTDPQDPNNTINGSGLDPNTGEHSSRVEDMWISAMDDAEPSIQFEFETLQKFDKVRVWNHNSQSEFLLGFGIKEAQITYSVEGAVWSELGTVELAQASGSEDYAGIDVALDGIVAKYVKITALSNWSLLGLTQYGLSEVRFYAVPVYAREPQPADGVTTDGADITLQWRAGREAVSHEVLLSDDPNAVEDGSAVVGSVENTEFQTGPLSYDTAYFWQIVEVNEAATPAAYAGNVWQFITPPVGVIDDMEMYEAEEGLRIWEHWIDGFDNPDENGSVVGNDNDAEKSIVYNGSQSLPMAYNNNTAPKSEATRTFDAPLDLTASDVQALVLYFHGDAGNTGGSLYLKINDATIPYDSDAGNLQRAGWSKWFIPLADVTGTDLTQVTSLTIGVDNGGQGVVYVDDIVVTPESRELVTPVDPGADGLVSHYAFEGDAADSTGRNPGTITGFALFEQGAVGQAISLSGLGDNYVEITGYQGIVADADGVQPAFSVACWFNTSENGDMVTWGSATGTPVGGQYMTFRIEAGNLRTEHGDGNIRGNTTCNDGEWHHGALTVVEGANLRVPNTILYIDGQADGINSGSDNVYNVTADADVNIGQRASHADRWFPGLLDEVMIYDRALSAGEVAALAGRTLPFDKP